MLLKNAIQTFRKKWMQLFAVGIIMFFSAFVYSSMYYAMSGLEQPTLDYLETQNQEDFSIDMLSVLTPDETFWLQEQHDLPTDIYTLADLYRYRPSWLKLILQERLNLLVDLFPNATYEIRIFKDIYFGGPDGEHRALLIKDSEEINEAYIEQGNYPEPGTQIALTRVYAEKNNLDIGDYINIQDEICQISGFVLFPDYTYAVLDQSMIVDNAKLTLILADQQIFNQLHGQIHFRVAGLFTGNQDPAQLEEALMTQSGRSVSSSSFILGAVLTENQFRSGAIFDAGFLFDSFHSGHSKRRSFYHFDYAAIGLLRPNLGLYSIQIACQKTA